MRKHFPILLLACASWIQATVAMKVPFGQPRAVSAAVTQRAKSAMRG